MSACRVRGRLKLEFAALCLGLIALTGAPAWAGVVINEIHYHPPSPGGKTLEFVELLNDSAEAIDIGGWRFSAGIQYRFDAETLIEPGGFVVVARDRDAFLAEFQVSESSVFGNYDGVLSNGGEAVELVDATNAFVDRVVYDDLPPWPRSADGDAASLERICASGPSWTFRNWSARLGDLPTPLATNNQASCPLPQIDLPPVVINEINYHPPGAGAPADGPSLGGAERGEFVELLNRSDAPVDVSGWSFLGIRYSIPANTSLAPGEILVVCRDEEFIRGVFGISNTVGNFEGLLSNGGERLALVDGLGVLVDFVRYSDQDEWPIAADSGGRSLERIHPDLLGDDPASWQASGFSGEGFVKVSVEGMLSNFVSQRAMVGVNGVGEFIVDNVILESLDNPGVNVLESGGFEEGLGEWRARGAAAESRAEPGIGVDGSWGLRVTSDRICSTVNCTCSTSQAVAQTIRGLDSDALYRFSLDLRPVSGSLNLFAGMLRGVQFCFRDYLSSPGRPNSTLSESAPPIVTNLGRFPLEPTSEDNTIVSAAVRVPGAAALESVELHWQRRNEKGVEETGVEIMADDGAFAKGGASGDSRAGDGVFSTSLPKFPHDSAVTFFILARTEGGLEGSWPRMPSISEATRGELAGFYVNDEQVDSQLPVYQIILPEADETSPDHINGVLNCVNLEECDFAFGGDLYPSIGARFRGNTACFLKKRNLKLRFNRGRWFRGVSKLNLQGVWTDKGLVREHLGWEFIRQLGIPYCETEHVRLHLNGTYHGLFLYLEHPDERFLERNGLSGFDCLYKAKQPTNPNEPPIGVRDQDTPAQYEAYWERETCEDEDYTELADFVGALHSDASTAPGPSAEFHLNRTYVEWHIAYQITQSVLNNIDSFAKNHFLLWDRSADRWALLPWDMDLIMGKNFDGRLNRLEPRRVGTINDCMLSPGNDLNPWFTTRVNGNTQLHFLVDFLFRAERGYFQRAYIVRMLGLLAEKFNASSYRPILDQLARELQSEQDADFQRWGRSPVTCLGDCNNCARDLDMAGNLDTIIEQITLHRVFLLQYARRFHREWMDFDRMKITEVMFNPPGAAEDLEYLELVNNSERHVDLSDWQFTEGIQFVFPRETVVAPYGVVIVAKSREAFLARYTDLGDDVIVLGDYTGSLDNEGEALRLVDAGPGHPATIDYLDYEDGGVWPDIRAGHSIELASFDLDLDNDLGSAWQMSPEPFGTPGKIVGIETKPFVRGDTNGDLSIDVTDAVLTLRYVWDIADDVDCPDAADTNDDGRIAVDDAVMALRFLFLRGDEPPAPFPGIGFDPTEDSIVCE